MSDTTQTTTTEAASGAELRAAAVRVLISHGCAGPESDAAMKALEKAVGAMPVAAVPVAWAFEYHVPNGEGAWEHRVEFDEPREGHWLRNVRPLFETPQPAGAERVDLGQDAVEAAAQAYYDGMIGRVEDQWPHHDGWAGKSETFKAKVRFHMARALEAARLASDEALTTGAAR